MRLALHVLPSVLLLNFNPRIPYGMRPTTGTAMIAYKDFNPRIPYGMRLALTVPRGYFSKFQSTHPVWDATTSLRIAIRGQAFQSTHPVWDATFLFTAPGEPLCLSSNKSACRHQLI